MTVATLFRRPPVATPDRDLLRRFADGRDNDAFAALVHRYGRLVFATCLRVLNHRADAEDAYQATFLVLARRAASVRAGDALPGWLHTVAVRTATEVRRMRSQRASRDQFHGSAGASPSRADPLEQSELASALDEELAKLPDHYRLAVVLCELNGASRKDAAKQLGVAEGTLSSRLAKARKLLAERLSGRGFGAAGATALTAALANSIVAKIPLFLFDTGNSELILNSTIRAVSDTVVKAMYATKLKAGVLAVVLLAVAGGGAIWATATGAGPGDQPAPAKEKAEKDDPASLVRQLGSKGFAEREAAENALRVMGTVALPAVQAGLKSDNPEVVARCRKLTGVIHKEAREAFAAAFLADKDRTAKFDHPIWTRYVGIAGDSRASRAVFAELLKYDHPNGLEVLDRADREPDKADELYRDHLSAVAKQIEPLLKYSFSIHDLMPGHTTGIAAYTLFLGSMRTTATDPDKLPADERVQYANGRNTILKFGDGLKEGLNGNVIVTAGPQVPKGKLRAAVPGPVDTDKVFARLTAAFVAADWLRMSRWDVADPFSTSTIDHPSPGLPEHLRAEVLPTARRVIADNTRSPLRRALWIPILRQHGDATDAARLAVLFGETALLPDRNKNFADGTPVEVREWAIGTALVLRDKNPADFGFDRFPKPLSNRHRVSEDNVWRPSMFAIAIKYNFQTPVCGDPEGKEKALKAAIAWLDGEAKKDKEEPKADNPAALVARLGSKEFAEREAAQKQLKALGAAAYAAVTAGMKSDNPEIVARCRKLLPDVRAAWLARPESDVWKRFTAITGDTPFARELFLEMASEPSRADLLTDDTPAEAYRRVVEKGNAALRAGYARAEREAGGRTGILRPASGLPTRGDATLLFLLGSRPETGAANPEAAEQDRDRWPFPDFLGQALAAGRPGEKGAFPVEARKLFVAWLAARRDAGSIRVGLSYARSHEFAEARPLARALLANDRFLLAERTPALFLLGIAGTKADLDSVRPFLDCETVYHETKYTDEARKSFPLTTQVRDVAHAVAGKLLGAEPLDLGFEFCELYKARGGGAFRDDYKLGFTSDAKRAKAHANVTALLKDIPAPKDAGPAKPKKLPRVGAIPDELRKEFAGPSVISTEKRVGELEARAAELMKKFPAAEDRARIALYTASAIANGRLREDAAKVKAFAETALELSRDPVTRWKARSLHASTIYISGKPFAEMRREQAEVLLAGYAELLVQDLPDTEPEWSAGPGKGDFDGETAQEKADREAIQAAHLKARAEAEFTKELVFGRKVVLMQLRDLYGRKPVAPDELQALAAKKLTAGEVTTLMARVFDEK